VGAWLGGLCALGLALASGCAPPPLELDFTLPTDGRLPDRIGEGLQRVQVSQVSALYVRPEADFQRYDAVLIDPIGFSYRSPPGTPAPFQRRPGNYRLRPDAEERMRRTVREALARELAQCEVKGGMLRLSPRIADLVWEVPDPHGSEAYVVNRTGLMTLVVEVRDSATGELLALFADRRQIRPMAPGLEDVGYDNSAVNNWSGVRDVSAVWARLFRETLEALRRPASGATSGAASRAEPSRPAAG
jgi:hypothetical protein